MIFTSVVVEQFLKGGQTGAWILGFHSDRSDMVYYPSVGPPLQLCGGLLKAGCHNFYMTVEGVMHPLGSDRMK